MFVTLELYDYDDNSLRLRAIPVNDIARVEEVVEPFAPRDQDYKVRSRVVMKEGTQSTGMKHFLCPDTITSVMSELTEVAMSLVRSHHRKGNG